MLRKTKGTLDNLTGRPTALVGFSNPSSADCGLHFLEGSKGEDAQLLDKALEDRQVLTVPVVLTELLSDPKLPSDVAETLSEVPMIEIEPGYWQRAGILCAKAIARGRKARLGDALIAQTCIDGEVSLRTRDRDFRASAMLRALICSLGLQQIDRLTVERCHLQ